METAKDHNGEPIDAADLQAGWKRQGGEAWLRERRAEGFWCPECDVPLIFVRGGVSQTGNSPYFRTTKGVPHAGESCKQEVRPRGNPDPAVDGEVIEVGMIGDGGVKAMRYDEPVPLGDADGVVGGDEGEGAAPGGGGGRAGGGVRYIDGGGAHGQQETTSLRRCLGYLRSMPGYPGPDTRLNITDRGEVYARDYFCHFKDATDDLNKETPSGRTRLMAFWGVVDNVNPGAVNLFINISECDGGAVMLTRDQAKDLSDALGVELKELEGCHIIAEGRMEPSPGSRLVRVEDISKIQALRPKNPRKL